MMDKEQATDRLGNGSENETAAWIGIPLAVYREWPMRLPPIMLDRVYAAVLRKETARALGMTRSEFMADYRGEIVLQAMLQRVSIAAVLANLMERLPPGMGRNEDEPATRRKRPGRSARNTAAPPDAANNDTATAA